MTADAITLRTSKGAQVRGVAQGRDMFSAALNVLVTAMDIGWGWRECKPEVHQYREVACPRCGGECTAPKSPGTGGCDLCQGEGAVWERVR